MVSASEKNMITGAFASGITDTMLEAYYAYKTGSGYDIRAHPEDPAYYLYFNVNEWLPPMDDLIALVGVPVGLWAFGKYRKSQKLREAGIGGMIYGFSDIIGQTVLKLARASGGKPVYRIVSYGGNSR